MTKYIFISGGVVSSLGKGITSASIGTLLQSQGFRIKIRKIDPYLNIDAGTINPDEHGEVYVTEDGCETDLDFGYYERFTGVAAKKEDSITAGKLYQKLLLKERRGDYLGSTVQTVPHFTNIIKESIAFDSQNYDFIICEIGGTVGDIESLPFFEAIRQLRYEIGRSHTMCIHLTLMPYLKTSGEIKTKPTQHSIKELQSLGISPEIIVCRSEEEISQSDLKKISMFCSVKESHIIQAIDESNIYNVPLSYYKQKLDQHILAHFELPYKEPDLSDWSKMITIFNEDKHQDKIIIGIIGKYTTLEDSYKSIIEALNHTYITERKPIEIKWILPQNINANNVNEELKQYHGILVPGGFGQRGVEEKILAIEFARKNNIPLFGICLGMQLSVIEFARNVLKLKNPNSLEFAKDCLPIFTQMDAIIKKEDLDNSFTNANSMGGTMRLGHYECRLQKGSKAHLSYNKDTILERHRHRYEFNNALIGMFENSELSFTGMSKENLVEIVELKNHPWFIGCQFHPEFQSSPLKPHPLFVSFVRASEARKIRLKI
jgi:CTP synthase